MVVVAIKVTVPCCSSSSPGSSTSTPVTGRRSMPPSVDARPGAESTPSLLQDLGLGTGTFGVGGIFTGAALVFFAFIGFRHRRHRRRRRPAPAAGPADRHLRLPADLHGSLRRGVAGDHRDGPLQPGGDRGASGQRVPRRRRVGHRADQSPFGALAGLTTRSAHPAARPEPDPLRHEPRPAAAARVLLRVGEVRHALPHDDLVGCVVPAAAVVSLDDLADLVNIGTLLPSCSSRSIIVCAAPALTWSAVPHARRAVRADPLRAGLLLPDAQPAGRRGCGSASDAPGLRRSPLYSRRHTPGAGRRRQQPTAAPARRPRPDLRRPPPTRGAGRRASAERVVRVHRPRHAQASP